MRNYLLEYKGVGHHRCYRRQLKFRKQKHRKEFLDFSIMEHGRKLAEE